MSPPFLLVYLLSAFSGAAAVSVDVQIDDAGRQKFIRSESPPGTSAQSRRAKKVDAEFLAHLKLKYEGLLESFDERHVSPEELARLEKKYGGFVKDVVRHVYSHTKTGGAGYTHHQGGDRFIPNGAEGQHDYGNDYAEYLNQLFYSNTPIQQVAEVGILKGSGLAMWLEMFPGHKVYGFDLDPSNFEANRGNLKKLGMNDANLTILQMDQTLDNSKMLADQIGGKFTFVVDDGCHTEFCARKTFKSFLPRMTDKFVYIIEDGAGEHLVNEIKGMASGVHAEYRPSRLTMVSRGL